VVIHPSLNLRASRAETLSVGSLFRAFPSKSHKGENGIGISQGLVHDWSKMDTVFDHRKAESSVSAVPIGGPALDREFVGHRAGPNRYRQRHPLHQARDKRIFEWTV
jgi:hypothetical protein